MLTKTIVRIQANTFTAKNFCGNSKLQPDIGDYLQKQILNLFLWSSGNLIWKVTPLPPQARGSTGHPACKPGLTDPAHGRQTITVGCSWRTCGLNNVHLKYSHVNKSAKVRICRVTGQPLREVSPQLGSPTLLPWGPTKGVRKEKAVTPVTVLGGTWKASSFSVPL